MIAVYAESQRAMRNRNRNPSRGHSGDRGDPRDGGNPGRDKIAENEFFS